MVDMANAIFKLLSRCHRGYLQELTIGVCLAARITFKSNTEIVSAQLFTNFRSNFPPLENFSYKYICITSRIYSKSAPLSLENIETEIIEPLQTVAVVTYNLACM